MPSFSILCRHCCGSLVLPLSESWQLVLGRLFSWHVLFTQTLIWQCSHGAYSRVRSSSYDCNAEGETSVYQTIGSNELRVWNSSVLKSSWKLCLVSLLLLKQHSRLWWVGFYALFVQWLFKMRSHFCSICVHEWITLKVLIEICGLNPVVSKQPLQHLLPSWFILINAALKMFQQTDFKIVSFSFFF